MFGAKKTPNPKHQKKILICFSDGLFVFVVVGFDLRSSDMKFHRRKLLLRILRKFHGKFHGKFQVQYLAFGTYHKFQEITLTLH